MSLVSLYHKFPAPLRAVIATARGAQLRWWRYGRETEALVEEALDREHWSASRLAAWQQEQLAHVLQHAATRVPYYRASWERRRRAGDRASTELLENWPLLAKDELRANPRAFISDDCDARGMFHEHTSGTTGTPLNLWFTRRTLHAYYAVYEARVRRRFGVTRHDRWANIGGQQIVPFEQRKAPFWVWNAALHQLYMSSYHLAPAFVPAYVDALRAHHITYALGYASSLYSLATLALEHGCEPSPLRLVVTNAEPLFDYQRTAIHKAFGTIPRQTYGMSELCCSANECAHSTLHLWPEVGVVEVVSETSEAAVSPGETGRIVCTNLLNVDTPLIRYVVGDRGALQPEGSACACGRTLPALASIDGRLDDVLVTPDGRRIGRLDPVFKADLAIREAQIIQETLTRVRIRLVPTKDFTAETGEALIRSLRQRMGDVEVVLEQVSSIPRTAAGKFRAVINELRSVGSP